MSNKRRSKSNPESRSEERLKTAIKALHDAIPKSAQSYLKDIQYPDLNNLSSIELKAEELGIAIEQFTHQREEYNKDPGRVQNAKLIVQKWFRASYPFATVFLTIAKAGSNIPVLNPYALPCAGVLVLSKIAFDESGKAKDIDGILDFLLHSVERIQLLASVPEELASTDRARRAAVEVCAAICNYMATAIKTLRHGTLTNVVRTVFIGSDYQERRKGVDDAVREYTSVITDLGVSVGVQNWEQSGEVLKTVRKTNSILFEHDTAEKRARFRKWLSSAAALSLLARDTFLDDQRSSPPAWIFEHPIFNDWLANPNPSSNTIWISGTAGFGKSVLAAYLTESLKKKFADAPVTFFFCKEKEDADQVHQIVRTLLQQLIAQSSAMSQRVMTIWEADEDIADLNANYRDYYEKLLLPILQAFRSVSQKPIFIIIDGLDELRESRLSEALAFIGALQADSSLRVLLTSQPTKTINAALRTTVHLSLTGDDNLDNVETFVKCGLNETLTTLFNEIGVDPIKYFREKCLGMFLWVRAILDLIGPIDVNTDLQKILDNPPRSIGELYQKVLERLFCDLNEIELPWIQEIITWTVMSKRDLTLAEIEVAILLSGETDIKSSKSRVLNIEATLNKCATILRVTVNPSTKVKTIGLIHDSFIRFITNPNPPGPSGLARCFLVVKAEADCRLATACISHLCNETLEIESREIIPDERRKRLNAQFPMFNYATAYWAKHMNHKGTLKMQQQIALAVSNFLLRENFRNWITSVMAYTYNAYQGALYDPLSLSIPTSIQDAVGWIVQSPSFTEKILSSICDSCPSIYRRISLNNNLPKALAPQIIIRRWCAAIVAEVWKVGDPKRWEISFRCFEIARNLGLNEEEIDSGKLRFENVVRMVAALAHSSSRKNPFRWLANEANVYIRNGRLESQTLADSALRLALESATGAEKAVVLTRLSSCFTNVYYYTDSLEDLNKSITYAEDALETAETNRQYDYFHYFEPLSRQLFLRSRRTVQFASDAADRDWRRAVKLGMQALRLALTYDTYIEHVSPVVRSPEDSDWKSLPLLRYSSTESNEPIFHPSVFDVLNTLSLGFSIQPTNPTNPTNPTQLDDLRELIDTCKKALTSMTEHNPAFWSTLGHALFSLHTTASRARKTSAEQQHRNAGPASGTHSHQQPANSNSASQDLLSAELQESIECYRKALCLTPNDHPDLPMYTANLARALLEIHGSGTHLDEAIDCWRRAIDMTPDGQMEIFEYFHKLGSSLVRRNGSITDTTEAMACYRKVIDLAPERHIYLPFAAFQLGIVLTDVELVADVTEAIKCLRLALNYLPKGNPQFHSFANRLGIAFYKRAQPPDDYTHALEYYQQAAASVSKGHQSYPIYVANAADALYRRLHDGDISKAIDNYRETLQLRSETDVDIPRYEHSLALALRERAWDGDLDEAIEHTQKALAHPGGSAKHYEYHNVLGLILQSRNGARDLDRSVQCHRRALDLFSERDEESHILENNLGTAFYNRKADGDIRKAQQNYLRAIEIATRGDATSSEIATYANNLGNTYAVDDSKTDDLEIAAVWYQKAVELECEEHLLLARYLTSLVATMLSLCRGVYAIDFARIAIALTPEDHAQQPVRYQLLAECLRTDVDSIKYVDDVTWIPRDWHHDDRFGVSVTLNEFFTPTRSITIADESVSAVTWAIELSRRQKNDEQMAHSLGVLSECLMGRYTLSKRIDDLEEANVAMRNIFQSKWRKDIKTRLFDMVRFGAVCLKRYVVVESQPIDALITFTEMADEISDIGGGSDGEVFGQIVQAMKSLAQCLLSKVAVIEGNGRSLE